METDMTMACERTRAVVETRQFLLQLKSDAALPEVIRMQAKALLRHYPEPGQIAQLALLEKAVTGLEGADLPPFISLWSPVFE
ncbi:BPSL0761 family protein [Pseudomonas songnenensis]|uniref:BPSL0761 family protein n=1 Tax=Pseudomonas songnenensis TaxID=1176259 RepID=UPI0028AB76E0|nr:BPSL0761 family protein [Pseudomonas songnenensis]